MIKTNPCPSRFEQGHKDCKICDGYALVRQGERLILQGLRENSSPAKRRAV